MFETTKSPSIFRIQISDLDRDIVYPFTEKTYTLEEVLVVVRGSDNADFVVKSIHQDKQDGFEPAVCFRREPTRLQLGEWLVELAFCIFWSMVDPEDSNSDLYIGYFDLKGEPLARRVGEAGFLEYSVPAFADYWKEDLEHYFVLNPETNKPFILDHIEEFDIDVLKEELSEQTILDYMRFFISDALAPAIDYAYACQTEQRLIEFAQELLHIQDEYKRYTKKKK